MGCKIVYIVMNNLIVSLPEETESHIFSFLTTPELMKFQKINSKTYKKIKACVFLRRVHSTIREHLWFDNCKFSWNNDRERTVLTNIRDKIVNHIGCCPTFAERMDPNSLTDFNRSIEWLEDYQTDIEFIQLLMVGDINGDFWTSYEQVYVDNWRRELKSWCYGIGYMISRSREQPLLWNVHHSRQDL